jgi:hypothetical protein
MPTLDYTKGGSSTGTAIQWSAVKNTAIVSIRLNVADIIAQDATMTANGYIAANDVIQIMNWPTRHVPTMCALETKTAGTASSTADIGIAGGQELGAAYALDATAGTLETNSVADGSIDDLFAGADTLDFEVLVANLLVGDYRVHLWVANLTAKPIN